MLTVTGTFLSVHVSKVAYLNKIVNGCWNIALGLHVSLVSKEAKQSCYMPLPDTNDYVYLRSVSPYYFFPLRCFAICYNSRPIAIIKGVQMFIICYEIFIQTDFQHYKLLFLNWFVISALSLLRIKTKTFKSMMSKSNRIK